MDILIPENRDWLRRQLLNFYIHLQWLKQENQEIVIGPVVDGWLDNEASMAAGLKQHYEDILEIAEYNKGIMLKIKKYVSRTFYKHLVQFVEDREPCDYFKFELVGSYTGEHQKVDGYGRSIVEEWVDQRSVGDSGDSFEGTICVQVYEDEYLKFHFSC